MKFFEQYLDESKKLQEKIMEEYIQLIIKLELIFNMNVEEDVKEQVRDFILTSIKEMMPAIKSDYTVEPNNDGLIVKTRTSSSFGILSSTELSSEIGETIKGAFTKLELPPKTIKKYHVEVETEEIASETDTF